MKTGIWQSADGERLAVTMKGKRIIVTFMDPVEFTSGVVTSEDLDSYLKTFNFTRVSDVDPATLAAVKSSVGYPSR